MSNARWRDGIQSDTRANQPLATAVDTGTLYHVTDEGVIERSSGAAWVQVATDDTGLDLSAVAQDIVPDADSTRDLGAAGTAFAEARADTVYTDTLDDGEGAAGITVAAAVDMGANTLSVDTVAESGAGNGVTLDGVLLKDDNILVDEIEVVGDGGTSQTDLQDPLQVASATDVADVGLYRATDDAVGPNLKYYKARGGGFGGSRTIVQNGDQLGKMSWYGWDGSAWREAIRLSGSVNPVPGAGDMPGKLQLYMTPDGSASPSLMWVIQNDGVIYPQTTSAIDIGKTTNVVQNIHADALYADTITETTGAAGVTVEGVKLEDTGVLTDTIEVVGSGGATQSDVAAPLVVASEDDAVHQYVYRASADSVPPAIGFVKARGSQGSPALVNTSDDFGMLRFFGHDGSTIREGVRITADVSTTPGAGDMPGRLLFYVNADGSAAVGTPTWSMDHSGSLFPWTTSNNDIGKTANVVQHVHAEGIAFPATQVPSATANTLDDYEEGSWTPVLTFATPGDLSVAYSKQEGYYTRVGRKVICNGRVQTSTFTYTTASGQFQVTGLPFTVANTTSTINASACIATGWTNANIAWLSASAADNTTYCIVTGSKSGAALDYTNQGDWPTGGTVDIFLTVVFHV